MCERRMRLECGFCQSLCNLQCEGCKLVYYCSPEHQRAHWKDHKAVCFKTEGADMQIRKFQTNILSDRRVIISSEDYKQGDIIFKEKPLVRGPDEDLIEPEVFHKMDTTTSCIVCYKKIKTKSDKKDQVPPCCPTCCWPLCGEICGDYHSQLECKILSRNCHGMMIFTRYIPPWKFILILRLILYEEQNKDAFDSVMAMNFHPHMEEFCRITDRGIDWDSVDETRMPALIVKHKIRVRHCLQLLEFYRASEVCNYSIDVVERVLKLVEWNAISLGKKARNGLYKRISLTVQSCTPNLIYSISKEDFKLVCIASKDIKKGDELSLCKVESITFQDNYQRSYELSRCFDICCICKRCTDPTEFNSNFGSIKCSEVKNGCKSGHVAPKRDFTVPGFIWSCSTCNVVHSDRSVQVFLIPLKDEFLAATSLKGRKDLTSRILRQTKLYKTSLAELKGGKRCEDFIERYQDKPLHKNHYLLFGVRFALCEMLSEGIHEIFRYDCQMHYKVQIQQAAKTLNETGEHLLHILDKISPGLTLLRAKVLYFIQQGFGLTAPIIICSGRLTTASKSLYILKMERMNLFRSQADRIFNHFEDAESELGDYIIWTELDKLNYKAMQHHPNLRKPPEPKKELCGLDSDIGSGSTDGNHQRSIEIENNNNIGDLDEFRNNDDPDGV